MIDSLGHLLGRAALVEQRVRSLIAERRAVDPAPDDPFRGLYLTDEVVDHLLDGDPDRPMAIDPGPAAALDEAAGSGARLLRLARDAGLTPLDVDLLVIAVLPDLDVRFERFYGYLNDDVSRRRVSAGLAFHLAGASPLAAAVRGRLESSRPLVRHRLIVVEDPDRPLLTRALRVPDRVIAHLLGDDTPDPALTSLLADADRYASPLSAQLAAALAAGVRLVHLKERLVGSGVSTATSALAQAGLGAVVLNLTRFAALPEPHAVARLAVREALLRGAGLVAGPVEHLADAHPDIIRWLTESGVPLLLVGAATWDPQWSGANPLMVEAPVLTVGNRLALWTERLAAAGAEATAGLDPAALAGHLALGPAQVRRAVEAAAISARLRDGVITPEDLRRGVRAQNAAGLERLARRIEPEVDWEDLVVNPTVRRALTDLAARARHRDRVLADWRMRRGGGRGRGVSALFAGDSGTGKTLAAEVIAADLGLDLYTVNLATVVDKYIGETEKNLERIFAEAGGVNAVLFFDEADAIFDGYYIMMDLLEVPNLQAKSRALITHHVKRLLFGVKGADPILQRMPLPKKRLWLFYTYAVLSWVYGYYVIYSLIVFMKPHLEPVGLGGLADWFSAFALISWVALPFIGFFKSLDLKRDDWNEGGRLRRMTKFGLIAFGIFGATCFLPWELTIKRAGTVELAEPGQVRPEVSGFVQQVLVSEGERVKAGMPVAVLVNREIGQARVEADMRLKTAEAAVQRALGESKPAELKQAENSRAAYEKKNQEAQRDLRSLTLTASRDGVVLTRDLEKTKGRLVKSGELFCEIAPLDPLRIKLALSEKQVRYLQKGQRVVLKAHAFPGREFTGVLAETPVMFFGESIPRGFSKKYGGDVLTYTDPKGREIPVERTFEALVEIENKDGALRPGMTVRGKIHAGWHPWGKLFLQSILDLVSLDYRLL